MPKIINLFAIFVFLVLILIMLPKGTNKQGKIHNEFINYSNVILNDLVSPTKEDYWDSVLIAKNPEYKNRGIMYEAEVTRLLDTIWSAYVRIPQRTDYSVLVMVSDTGYSGLDRAAYALTKAVYDAKKDIFKQE